jgi:hypothetical protein
VQVPGPTPTPFNGASDDQAPASGGGSGSAYVSLALLFASGALIVWVLTPVLRRRANVPVRWPRMRDGS